MSERGAFNRAARRSGGNRPARFNLPNLSKDDLEILQQEALIRREFGEEGVTRFWDRMEELNAPAYSQASELDADDYDAEFRKKQKGPR
jgi:hypothetical protein